MLTSRVLATAVLTSVLSTVAAAEEIGDYVKVRAYLDQDVFHAGQTARIAIEMRIDPRVHVNSDSPDDEFAIPTSVRWTDVPDGLTLSDITWPKPVRKAFEFTDGKKIPVLEGRQRAYLTAVLAESVAPGPLKLVGTFKAQGCTHVACYAPQTDPVKVTVRVVPSSEETLSVNESKFPKDEVARSGGAQTRPRR